MVALRPNDRESKIIKSFQGALETIQVASPFVKWIPSVLKLIQGRWFPTTYMDENQLILLTISIESS